MPANVSIGFAKAQQKYDQAKTLEEKLQALLEMRSNAPSHKGAENLRADVSRKIAQIKNQLEKQKEQAKKVSKHALHIKKEGAGQIALVGMPNSGKSFLLNSLTNAKIETANYEFTTIKPETGIMLFEGAKIQLVEIPAIVEGSAEGKASGHQWFSLIRNSDAIAITLNPRNPLEEYKLLEKEFLKAKIFLNRQKPRIEIKKTGFKGLSILGKKHLKQPLNAFVETLKSLNIRNAIVTLEEEPTIEKIMQILDESIHYKKSISIIAKRSKEEAKELEKIPGKKLVIDSIERQKKEIGKELFEILDKIRVFTKKPNQEPDLTEPLILKKNSTVEDLAIQLHKELYKNLKYAKVWGSTKFAGQRVSKDYELKDKDTVEISI